MTNNQNTEQLEPCPFCNGEGVVLNCTSSTAKWKEVKCKECGANARLEVWNTRTNFPKPDKDTNNELHHLSHFRDSSIGLWCIDQDPKDVTYEWILQNAFELKDKRYGKANI